MQPPKSDAAGFTLKWSDPRRKHKASHPCASWKGCPSGKEFVKGIYREKQREI